LQIIEGNALKNLDVALYFISPDKLDLVINF
jgi:hypothetical protein